MTTTPARGGPAPTTTLAPEQIERCRRDGFIALPRLLDDATLATLRDYYDRIVRKEIDLPTDRHLGGVTRQIMHPRLHLPYFRDNPAIRAAMGLTRQLLGSAEDAVHYDMLIYKPPGHPKPTPWHQDYAYAKMPFAAEGVAMDNGGLQFWIALDDVDVENGCMHFLPGFHTQGMKKHYVYAGDPADEGRLLATDAFGPAELPNHGIACPLSAGGCTIHFYGTPHYTPPNVSATRGRRAYIFNIRAKAPAA